MFKRIFRSLVVFAALVAAYQAYVLLAVPLMEPPLEVRQGRHVTPSDKAQAVNSVTSIQLLLSNYFPKGHWSQTQPPKVIMSSNEQAMLVIDEFTRTADDRANSEHATRVDIEHLALLIFPTPPREGVTPPRDVVILETSQKASLLFDDFRPEQGKIGRITRGQFPGKITIRSDMHEPGPADDLLVETADLEMNTKLLYTMSPVRFRMGQNVGAGRELEIRFLSDEHLKANDAGLKIAGIDSLEIRREVRMRLQLETAGLLPGNEEKKEPSPSPSLKGRGSEAAKPPVEVTCSGPFTFDFVRYVASLDRDVDLRQLNPNGPSDQLFCSQLDIHFAPKLPANAGTQPIVVAADDRQKQDLGRLEPAAIVAEGHPVVVNSPSRNAQARGDRIQILLREQRVGIGGGRDAMLVYGPNVLRAPAIEYQHPARGSATTIGRFRATGPGSLQYAPDPAKPEQILHAAWQTSVSLDREKGQPVLILDGRPKLAYGKAGSLTADRIAVHLRELEDKTAAGVGVPIAGGASAVSKLQVAPDQLTATGSVEIQSAQLTGRTGELTTTFRLQPEADVAPATAPVGSDPADTPLPANSPPNPFNLTPTDGTQKQSFHIDSDKMRMEVNMQGQSAVPSTVFCDGNVVFREVPLAVTNEQPLEIRGGQLIVDRLDGSTAHVVLRGAAPGEGPGSKLAQLTGRGVTMLVDVVELDGRENRMWSDGPGKATLLVTRDLQGQTSATPFPLEILWQGGLQFNGETVVFEREVLVAGADDTLRCGRLSAKLNTPIKFGAGIDQRSIDLAEIECQGQVTIDHRSRDKEGVTSHERMQLARLTINQQTGAISGDGPGIIKSTRFGSGLAALTGGANPAATVAPVAAPGAAGTKLHFLRVDFHKRMGGNIFTRELTFYERIRTVYGPVDSWEQELDANRPETLPSDAMTLACNEMRINEDPVAARALAAQASGENRPIGPVQLRATGNVRIDGQVPQQGAFSAQAEVASYEQAKDKFILEGDGRTPARLWRAGQRGAPPEARRIIYVRSTHEFKVDGIQYFEITPGDLNDLQNARRPQDVR